MDRLGKPADNLRGAREGKLLGASITAPVGGERAWR